MSDIEQLPSNVLLEEKRSQKNRIVKEVMEVLFDRLPDKKIRTLTREYDFTLKDGTKCWIKQFVEPREDDDELYYCFDVWFEEGKPLSHLEFKVTCSGFGGSV